MVRSTNLSIIYRAYNIEEKKLIYIEEFYPKPFVARLADKKTVEVTSTDPIQFKTLMSDILDKWQRVSRITSNNILKTREVLLDNETAYRLTDYYSYKTLDRVINKSGAMTWEQCKNLFMPICTLVADLHSKGLTHCGICPDNILISEDSQKLILVGFALPEVRTEGSILTPTLYTGYSAPEQYSKNMWQGEWTDVYSLGAVMYYAMSAVTPVHASDRLGNDTMYRLSSINKAIPTEVSEAVFGAMQPQKTDRFANVAMLTSALLKSDSSGTAVFSHTAVFPAKKDKEEPTKTAPQKKKKKPSTGRKTRMVAVVLGIMLILSVAVNIILTTQIDWVEEEQLPSESTSVSISEVPKMEFDFVGVHLEKVEDIAIANGVKIEYRHDYNEVYPIDVVFEQSVELGEELVEGETVVLYVSEGSEYVEMPYIIGAAELFAIKTMTDLDVDFEIVYDEDADSNKPVGTVIAVDKPFNQLVRKETELVTITVKRQ